MSRTLFVSVLVWLALATLHAAAQQPASARAVPRSTSARATESRVAPKVLPGTRPDVFSTIQGNALSATNGPLPNTYVRLRDARIGQIVETQLTDTSGLFTFRQVDPGSYIVEIVTVDQSQVLAASQVLTPAAGEAVSAIVKLPFRVPFAGLLGNSVPSAAAVTSQAAASGVLATQIAGAGSCDTLLQ